MNRIVSIGFLLLLLLVVAALSIYKTQTPPAELAVQALPTAEFGGVSLRIEYATTTVTRESGLGGRTLIPKDYAMLFVFAGDDYYGFWMKDMLVPLDIFWLDSKGHVVSIIENAATSSYPNVFYPTAPARYVLETAAGFAHTHGIVISTPLELKNFPTVTE